MTKIRLAEIWIYPIKSLGGIRVKTATVLGKGLQYDRRYMLIDENNQFITQRIVHEMALFKLSFYEEGFLVTLGSESIKIPFSPTEGVGERSVTIWKDTVLAHELGSDISNWFSERLNFKCRLVYFPEENRRAVDTDFAHNDEQVSLADGYPFLIIGRQSLEDLNKRLAQPVPMNRFRPNFVFEGGAPYEEDTWNSFRIGSNRFKGVKLCDRCVLTTINQDTAENGVEPLATLSKYRKNGGKVNFGQNLVTIDFFEVNEGDTISIDSFQ